MSSENEFIVASDTAIFIYDTKGRTGCYVFEDKAKGIIKFLLPFNGYLVQNIFLLLYLLYFFFFINNFYYFYCRWSWVNWQIMFSITQSVFITSKENTLLWVFHLVQLYLKFLWRLDRFIFSQFWERYEKFFILYFFFVYFNFLFIIF